MEEERGIGNIVFYIIAAIIAIISSLRSRKKQQTTPPGGGYPRETEEPDYPEGAFEEDEQSESYPETFLPGEHETSGEFAYEHSQGDSGLTEGSYEEPMAAQFSGEGVSALDAAEVTRRFEELMKAASAYDPVSEVDLAEDQQQERIDFDNLMEQFDPMKAVIYSEILHRKEY